MSAPLGVSLGSRWLLPLAIVLLALTIRVAVVVADSDYAPANDSSDYARHARSISAGEGYPEAGFLLHGGPTAIRPPGYPYLLGGVYAVSGDSVDAARVAGAALGALTVLLVYLVAMRLWGRRVGLIAAGMSAVFPPLVLLSTELYSESLFLPLMLGAVVCVLMYRSSGLFRWVVAVGVLSGLAALTRSVGLLLLIPLLLGVWTTAPRLTARALLAPALLLLCAAVTVAPWTARNAVEFGRFIPVATGAGFTFAGVYNETSEQDSDAPGAWRVPQVVPGHASLFVTPGLDEATVDEALRSEARRFAWEHPGYVVEAAAWGFLRLFEVAGGSVVGARGETVDERGIGSETSVEERVAIAIAVPLALLGVFALLRSRAGVETRRGATYFRRAPVFVWLIPIMLLASAAVVGGLPRYRLLADPFLLMLAAIGLVWAVGKIRAFRPRRAHAAAALAAGAIMVGIAGCDVGGGEDETSGSSPPEVTEKAKVQAERYRAKANALCRGTARDSRRLGRAFADAIGDGATDFLAVTTDELVAPGVRVLERHGERLRRLGAAPDPGLDVYVGFFDPIVELARGRLRAGRANDFGESRRLEMLLVDLGAEQQAAARNAGLADCDRDLLLDLFAGAST